MTSLGASLLWSPVTNLALGVSSQWQGGSFTPAASVRWQLLSEAVAPVNLTAFVRFRAVGMESTGSELDAKLAFGRTLGRVGLTGNVLVGKGLGHRGDVDFEASSLASYRLTSAFRTGIEGRVHFELVDEFKTPEDGGGPSDWWSARPRPTCGRASSCRAWWGGARRVAPPPRAWWPRRSRPSTSEPPYPPGQLQDERPHERQGGSRRSIWPGG
ncbi:hypothetical protein ACN28S_39095 [Cystobacter fuscus]